MQPPYPGHREHCETLLEERRRSHPHAVRQRGLLRVQMAEDVFLQSLDERRRWIASNCRGSFWVDDLTDNGLLIGKLYRFADIQDADCFRYRF